MNFTVFVLLLLLILAFGSYSKYWPVTAEGQVNNTNVDNSTASFISKLAAGEAREPPMSPAKPTPPSIVYPDFHSSVSPWFDFRLSVPSSYTNQMGAILVEIRGWIANITGAGPNLKDDPRDFSFNLELDPAWTDLKGIDLNQLIRVGSIFRAHNDLKPGANEFLKPGAVISRPLIHVEAVSWHTGQKFPSWCPNWLGRACDAIGIEKNIPRPNNWLYQEPPGVFWAWNPRSTSDDVFGTRNILKDGDYVKIVGALVTDNPHQIKWDPRLRGSANPARWTEIHPPDMVERVFAEKKAQAETVRCLALFGENGFPSGEVRRMDVDISPPGLKPDPFATVGFKEVIDNKNTFSSRILEGNNGDNFGNDAAKIDTFSDHIHVHVAVQGLSIPHHSGSTNLEAIPAPGKFKACYRVFWEPGTQRLTTLTLNPISDTPWSRVITLSGKLTDSNTGAPIPYKFIRFSGSGLANTGAIEAYTQPDGTFSFRTSVPSTVSNGWTARAEFFGEGNHLGSKSNIITFNTVKRAVDLTVTAKDVPWGLPTSFTAILIDKEGDPIPIISSGEKIHFNGTGVINASDQDTVNMVATSTGVAPNTVASDWTVNAEFAGNEKYLPAESNAITYATTKHVVSLTVTARDIPWGLSTRFTATLSDVDTRGTGISGKTVHFFGTGAIGVADKLTDVSGKAIGNGTAPKSVANGWIVNAEFNGDALYQGTTASMVYNTQKRPAHLILHISPEILNAGGNYSVEGQLVDKITGDPLSSRRITFSSLHITIPDAMTDNTGIYSVSNLTAPNNPGFYIIRAEFAGDSLYTGLESNDRALHVQ